MTVIHHLNCASFCPACARLTTGEGSWFTRAHLCSHCLLIEDAQAGLVLVDTGIGLQDIVQPKRLGAALTFGRSVGMGMMPKLDAQETAHAQVMAKGFQVNDVQHIIVTHLDPDHAGGLSDFPHATVHVHAQEHHAALAPKTWAEKSRYRRSQFKHHVAWQLYDDSTMTETWFGFEGVARVQGIQTEIVLVPLMGHTRGHMGVAVYRDNKWLLHVGDLVMNSRPLRGEQRAKGVIPWVEHLLAIDNAQRLRNVKRVIALYQQHAHQLDIICSHDIHDLRRFTV